MNATTAFAKNPGKTLQCIENEKRLLAKTNEKLMKIYGEKSWSSERVWGR